MIPSSEALQDKTNLPGTPRTDDKSKATLESPFWNINENS